MHRLKQKKSTLIGRPELCRTDDAKLRTFWCDIVNINFNHNISGSNNLEYRNRDWCICNIEREIFYRNLRAKIVYLHFNRNWNTRRSFSNLMKFFSEWRQSASTAYYFEFNFYQRLQSFSDQRLYSYVVLVQ